MCMTRIITMTVYILFLLQNTEKQIFLQNNMVHNLFSLMCNIMFMIQNNNWKGQVIMTFYWGYKIRKKLRSTAISSCNKMSKNTNVVISTTHLLPPSWSICGQKAESVGFTKWNYIACSRIFPILFWVTFLFARFFATAFLFTFEDGAL